VIGDGIGRLAIGDRLIGRSAIGDRLIGRSAIGDRSIGDRAMGDRRLTATDEAIAERRLAIGSWSRSWAQWFGIAADAAMPPDGPRGPSPDPRLPITRSIADPPIPRSPDRPIPPIPRSPDPPIRRSPIADPPIADRRSGDRRSAIARFHRRSPITDRRLQAPFS
jgi:hypothetical protein